MTDTILRYKYMPFDDGSLCVIREGTMKFTRPGEFNDPFDCVPDRVLNEDFAKGILQKIGICCLSRDPLNLLMWAHYARNHTGFVIEFSIPTQFEGTKEEANEHVFKWLVPQEVVYSKDKPIVTPNDSIDVEIQKQFLTKGEDWKYEQEERLIDYQRGPGIHRYDRKVILKSVIAGMKMNDKDYHCLETAIYTANKEDESHIRLYKAMPVKRQFKLNVPGRHDSAHAAKST